MPIGAKIQAVTLEDKLFRVIGIISTMRNQSDADLLRSFIFDLCQRYINKEKQFPSTTDEHFELEYIERLIKDLKL